MPPFNRRILTTTHNNGQQQQRVIKRSTLIYSVLAVPFFGVLLFVFSVVLVAHREFQSSSNDNDDDDDYVTIGATTRTFKTKVVTTPRRSLGRIQAAPTAPPATFGNKAERESASRVPMPKRSLQEPIASSSNSNFVVVKYHIIFSTGCSALQDWQSYVFFHNAMRVGQTGTVTRIASGCTPETQQQLQQYFDQHIAIMQNSQQQFRIHFTPDFSKLNEGETYKYFNKPFGVKHWMEHGLGFPNPHDPADVDALIVLVDPDQLILRPFANNDFSNTDWAFPAPNGEPYRTHVEHGKPMAQLYAFRNQWITKVDMKKVLRQTNYSKAPEESPLFRYSQNEAYQRFTAGPPYIATGHDMYRLAVTWCQFALPIHDQYPELLAEMFAYCNAAAHLDLPHQIASSFMVSDIYTGGNDEGWVQYVDKHWNRTNACQSETYNPVEHLPNVLHFCQRYGLGPWFFSKYKVPKDFLSCHQSLLKEPPSNVTFQYTETTFPNGEHFNFKPKHLIRTSFMLCRLIKAVNSAATYFKQHACANDPDTNWKKEFVFLPDEKVQRDG